MIEVATAPEWLLQLASKPKHGPQSAPANVEQNAPQSVRRATSHAKTWEPAIEGQGGDERTLQAAYAMRDLGCSEDKALEILEEHFNPRCEPPWDEDDLAAKVANAFKYAQNEPGCYATRPAAETFAHIIEAAGTDGDVPARDTKDPSEKSYPRPLTGSELVYGNFPRAEYLVSGLILKRHVNLTYGDGGVGKTTLSLHMAVAVAAGIDLFERRTIQAPVLLLLAEDKYGETKARLVEICGHLGVNLAHLPIKIWCLPGYDVTLATVADNGTITRGPFLDALEAELRASPGTFVVLDSLADIASLNESVRLPVNAMMKRLLGGMCEAFDATILVLGHPSKASMDDGTDYSGSTAFNNSVRSRLVLKRPTPSSSRRVLTVAKNNYGATGEIELFLIGSVFFMASEASRMEQAHGERDAVLSVVFELLDKDVSIVRANGSGQKPKDIADAVAEKHGFKIEPKRVLGILNAAERDGTLVYHTGGNRRRGQKAGYLRSAAR